VLTPATHGRRIEFTNRYLEAAANAAQKTDRSVPAISPTVQLLSTASKIAGIKLPPNLARFVTVSLNGETIEVVGELEWSGIATPDFGLGLLLFLWS
jgi:hypothetical protein